ncbi:MAG: tRNA glutamyl-Q(34) synthetase GluQRS [Burkholderiales bacterium]|nr:tRNA glutamyl-Q(34) synthetase GluQRS [Burkholderiales bacterium]
MDRPYRGRFAPSPTGPLHAGSLVAALASWLDARAQGGSWLVRIEDVDTPRCVPGADRIILAQLAACGMVPDEPPVWQSQRGALYQDALQKLVDAGLAYPCACSRKDIEEALAAAGIVRERHAELVYPGSCRDGLRGRQPRAWRLRVEPGVVRWRDRRLGAQAQDVAREVGDFVLKRADGLFAYQLAVVVDDADQGITHVVRGEDLTDNTARQVLLQRALGLPTPRYLHTPLVLGPNGEKLSKQNGATAVDVGDPVAVLREAGHALGIGSNEKDVESWLKDATEQWAQGHEPHRRPIRSYVLRAGRTTAGQARALEALGPRFLLPYQDQPVHLATVFGREAPTVLEIGFGMGDATAHIAALMPGTSFLCCEVHPPGVGALLRRIGEQGLQNIRIVQHDAVEVLRDMVPPASLAGVHVFFPDPWHKKRHHKRRLIQPPLVDLLASRLTTGAYIHCATDWEEYAVQMLEVLGAHPELANTAPGFAPRPAYRPLTKFENRGLNLGHGVWDVVFTRASR